MPNPFFYRQTPPPPPTPYWYIALLLSAITLIISPDTQILRCLPMGSSHPHLFWHGNLVLPHYIDTNTVIVRLIYTNDSSRKNAQYDDIMFMKNFKKTAEYIIRSNQTICHSIKRRQLLSFSSPRPLVILILVSPQLLQHLIQK